MRADASPSKRARSSWPLLAMMAGLACAVPAIPQAFAQPVTVTDALGRIVTVPAPPTRIITIFSSNTEIAAALGLTDRIVGIEAFTRFPPEVRDKPLVGGRLGFSVDQVVAQRPDLVVVTPARQAVHQLVDPMERLGIPVLVLTHRSVNEVFGNMRLLGRLVGVKARAETRIAALVSRLDHVARAVQTALADSPRPSAVMITGQAGFGNLLAVRPGTYTADAMTRAGLRLSLDGPRALPQLSPEAILRADPDILLFAGTEAQAKAFFAEPGWASARAVREGRVHAVPRAEFLIPGPRVVEGVERLARLVHGVRPLNVSSRTATAP
jgi:iron complex transport system substrate-binding protein